MSELADNLEGMPHQVIGSFPGRSRSRALKVAGLRSKQSNRLGGDSEGDIHKRPISVLSSLQSAAFN